MRLLAPLVLCAAPVFAAAEKPPLKGVDVSLVSEMSSIEPGKSFTVGLKIHHHEKYHTYWKSPGIAGVATEIEWDLPEGFKAGEIHWPTPEKSFMAKYPVHGYERDIVLLVEIQAPAVIKEARVDLKGTATWMACADGCYPGKVELGLVLPVSEKAEADKETAELFAAARKDLPRPLQGWTSQVVSAPDAAEVSFRLTPATQDAVLPADTYFFSSDGQVSSDKPQTLTKDSGGSWTISVPRSKYSPKGKPTLPGVLLSASPLLADGSKAATIDPEYQAVE